MNKIFCFSLNRAILDDSFILSPSKKLDLGDTSKDFSSQDENNRNSPNVKSTDSGLDLKFKSMHTSSEEDQLETFPTQFQAQTDRDEQLKIAYRPIIKTRIQLFPITSTAKEKPSERSVPSVFRKSSIKKVETEEIKADIVDSIHADSFHNAPDAYTPYKKVDQHQFVTPSIRSAITPFSSATTKKPGSFILQSLTERKDKPQAKILFTTPIARPPPGSLLESTPIELRKPTSLITSLTSRKLSPIKEPSNEKDKPDEPTITINNVAYLIGRKIGSGGSSSVFLARGKKSGTEVAIKLVRLDGEQQVVDGYLNETKLLAKLQGNRCVVTLFDYYHMPEKRTLYMVMEKGESDLHKILSGYRTHIPLDKLIRFWHQMLEAVNYIHMNGVIHSDLKPANFLMIEERLKLIDFGIASNIAMDSTSIIKFSQAGTFNYISPEALIDTSNGDSPSTHHQPRIRLSTKSDVSDEIFMNFQLNIIF